MRAVAFFVHGVEAVVRLFGWIAAWTCVVLVGLVAGDVLMRYVFSIGAIWLQELQWHLISPIALFGLPLRWLLKSLIPFGFLLLALQGLAHALRQAFALPTRGE
jgi:TRAP-type mannitol/chloroaromatic compound transport system permease small subunit